MNIQTSIEVTRSRALSPMIVSSQDSYSPWTLARVPIARSTACSSGCHFIFYIVLITTNIRLLNSYDMTSLSEMVVDTWSLCVRY